MDIMEEKDKDTNKIEGCHDLGQETLRIGIGFQIMPFSGHCL